MQIDYRFDLNAEATMEFDKQYEGELQFDLEFKRALLAACQVKVWLAIDGELAAEGYGITPKASAAELDDPIEDTDPSDDSSLYWYSTTVLPKFQGKGLGKMFRAYCLGLAMGRGYRKICGHVTEPKMRKIVSDLGAVFVGAPHDNWYGTSRSAQFYEITC